MRTPNRFHFLLFVSISSTASSFGQLSIEVIKENPDFWPARIAITEEVNFGAGNRFKSGSEVEFYGFNGTDVLFAEGGGVFRLEPELTDLVVRASAIAEGDLQGSPPRMIDYLVRHGNRVTDSGFEPVREASLPPGTLFLTYYGAGSCNWCGSIHPFMEVILELLAERHPGKFQLVHASGDQNGAAMRRYARVLGSGWIVTEPGDGWLVNNIIIQSPGVESIPPPTLALMTDTGRLIALGMRDGRSMEPVANLLKELDDILNERESRPETLASVD